jgi:hypothetical protein
MEIERTAFGAITIDGKTCEHDVIIRLSGEVARRKKLSTMRPQPNRLGQSHRPEVSS